MQDTAFHFTRRSARILTVTGIVLSLFFVVSLSLKALKVAWSEISGT